MAKDQKLTLQLVTAATAHLPDEGELPSLDGAKGWAQFETFDDAKTPR